MKKSLILLGLCLLSGLGQTQNILTLKDALTLAIENNFSIALVKNERDAAHISNSIGAAGMLPSLNGTVNQDNQVTNTKQTFLNGNENNRDGAKSRSLNAAVEMNWTIFNGMKMFATKTKLAEFEAMGDLKVRIQMEQVLARVSKAYYDAVLSKSQVKSAEKFLAISKKRIDVAKAKVETGKSAKSEWLKAQVYYNADYANYRRLLTQYENSKLGLNQLMTQDLNYKFEVTDSIEPKESMQLDALKKTGIENNTGLQMAKRNLEINHLLLKEINAERLPSLQLRSGYNYSTSNSEAGFLQSARNNGYHYGAGLSWNLFNGNDVNRRTSLAKIGEKSGEYIYKDSLLRFELNLQQAYNIYQTNLELWHFEESNLEIAKQNYEIAQEQYGQGIISMNDLREAEVIYLQNVDRLLVAKYNAKLSELELLRLSGILGK
jgi:outer membrane protein TolC